ncbi:MAG: hypothetical protein QXS41_00825 [Candidatus Woesearchaeota archaeon]
MRDDDGEFAIRLSKIPCRKKTIKFLRYSHPVCKGSNSPLSVYFINRNILFTSEYHSKYFFRSLVTNSLYLCLGLLFFIENRKVYYLKSVLFGIFDYIFGRKNFVVNEIRRREFKDKKIKENFPVLTTTRKKFKFHKDAFFLNPEIKMYFRKDKTISFKRIIKIGNISLLNIIAPFFKEKISLNYVQGDKIEYTFEQERKVKEIKNLFFVIPIVLFISIILIKLILLKAIIKKLF